MKDNNYYTGSKYYVGDLFADGYCGSSIPMYNHDGYGPAKLNYSSNTADFVVPQKTYNNEHMTTLFQKYANLSCFEQTIPHYLICKNHLESFIRKEVITSCGLDSCRDNYTAKIFLTQKDNDKFIIQVDYNGTISIPREFPSFEVIRQSFIHWIYKCKEGCHREVTEKDIKAIRKIIINHLEKTNFRYVYNMMDIMRDHLFNDFCNPIDLKVPHFYNGYLYSSLKTKWSIHDEIANIHKNSWILKMRKDSEWRRWCF